MNQTQRPMTVLFADLTGSVRMYEQLSPPEVAHAVDCYFKTVIPCIEAQQGHVVQRAGDELLAAFAAPDDACLAAIKMQTRIADLPAVSGFSLSIRIGMHSGLVSDSNGTLSGLPVVIGARITARASGGQILLSAPLAGQLPDHLRRQLSHYAELGPLPSDDAETGLLALNWQPASVKPANTVGPGEGQRLCIVFYGSSFVLDAASPPFTLGRDPQSDLRVEDRKASRKHGRIEHLPDGFHYIDSSTNGSFISFAGQTESLLRHDRIRLAGKGRICFGSSANDRKSVFLTFDLAS